MKIVTEPIEITDADTDATIMQKVSERIKRKIVAVEWWGESGRGVQGFVYVESPGGGEPEKIPFVAGAKLGIGGAFEVGDYIVPYMESIRRPGLLIARIEAKLARDGTLLKLN